MNHFYSSSNVDTVEVSQDYHTNLEKSVKITKSTNDPTYLMLTNINRFSCKPNKQYTCSLDLKLVNSACRLNLMTLDSNIRELHRVILDVSENDGQRCTLSIHASENTEFIRLLITLYGNAGGIILLDNISIMEYE